ncbi:hypothetical protein [Thermococcus sp.]|uniref:hypothetical protein n=1 Tax=Thermococcus sp. TaxID=35749 RepID=UPI00260F6871|nr:hypothetical protein [Thermococcus sp.]
MRRSAAVALILLVFLSGSVTAFPAMKLYGEANAWFSVRAVSAGKNGEFAVLGEVLGERYSSASILLFTAPDTLVWRRNLRTEEGTLDARGIEFGKDGIIVVGEYKKGGSKKPFILYLGLDGKVKKALILKDYSGYFNSISDGLAVGSVWKGDEPHDILVTKIGPEGNVEWVRVYGGDYYDSAKKGREGSRRIHCSGHNDQLREP